jgi:hypothetical protein
MSDEPISSAQRSRVGFESDIRPLFRESDRTAMRRAFDPWSYDDVLANGQAIAGRLRDGSMPCDGAWPSEQVSLFERWLGQGCGQVKAACCVPRGGLARSASCGSSATRCRRRRASRRCSWPSRSRRWRRADRREASGSETPAVLSRCHSVLLRRVACPRERCSQAVTCKGDSVLSAGRPQPRVLTWRLSEGAWPSTGGSA